MDVIKLKHGDTEYDLVFTPRALRLIEKELNKTIDNIGTKTVNKDADGNEVAGVAFQIGEVAIMIKHGLKVPDGVVKNEDFCDEVLEQNPGMLYRIPFAMLSSWTKLLTVAETGNSSAPETPNTPASTSGN